uniref:Uncharacterized protein n=1 Tax=Rhizophora mucronata TaxID=61149 RepID=A0A2P2J3E3_RHIMU
MICRRTRLQCSFEL